MATTNNKLINGSGLSELSSQIKSYVNNKSEIAVGATAPTNADIKIWVDTSIADTPATSISWENIHNKPTIPSIEGLASEAYVNEKVAAIVIPEVPTKVSAFENDKGYLTSHQSLTEYSTTTQVQAMISSAINAITNGNEVSY